jgi:hypothetical protein
MGGCVKYISSIVMQANDGHVVSKGTRGGKGVGGLAPPGSGPDRSEGRANADLTVVEGGTPDRGRRWPSRPVPDVMSVVVQTDLRLGRLLASASTVAALRMIEGANRLNHPQFLRLGIGV